MLGLFPLRENHNVAGELLNQLAQVIRPDVPLAGIEDQQPAV
jgi:hypothetical protein